MVKITLDNVFELAKRNEILKLSPVTHSAPNIFTLLEPVQIELSNGDVFTIDKGWEFDGASVPWIFQPLFQKFGIHTYSSLVHDMLYYIHYKNRKFADNEHRIWAESLKIKKIDVMIRFCFLRLFAWFFWGKGKLFPSRRLNRNKALTIKEM